MDVYAQTSTELTLKAVVVTTAVTVCDVTTQRLSIRKSSCTERTRALPGLTRPSVTEIRSTFVALRRWFVRAPFASAKGQSVQISHGRGGLSGTGVSLLSRLREDCALTTTVVTSFVAVETVAMVVASPEAVTGM